MKSPALDLRPRLHHLPRQATHPPRVRPFINAHVFRKQAHPLRSSPSPPTSKLVLAMGRAIPDTCRVPISVIPTRPTPPAREAALGGPLRPLILGVAASLGLALLLAGIDGHQQEALALGPEGPLVEEFWDNMRRYGLYLLTVSTGVIYAVFQPIVELLRNPLTAILIVTFLAGSAFLLSQVLSLMFGITEFAYDYGN